MLLGREAEADTVGALLEGARSGRSGVLVVRGDAGIGKTALLAHAVARADTDGFRVVRGSGIEFEAELPYAGLELLLRRAMGSIGSVPEPQQRALRAAFGLAAGTSGEPMFVGLAVLSLLAGHAGGGPLLCVVDDAQWLDRASADALVFAARRLDAEGVVMLLAARDGEGSFRAPGLPVLRLAGLDAAAAGLLLAERGAGLAPAVRRRVLAEAQGNPLALLELPLALAPATAVAGNAPGAAPAPPPAGAPGATRTTRAAAATGGAGNGGTAPVAGTAGADGPLNATTAAGARGPAGATGTAAPVRTADVAEAAGPTGSGAAAPTAGTAGPATARPRTMSTAGAAAALGAPDAADAARGTDPAPATGAPDASKPPGPARTGAPPRTADDAGGVPAAPTTGLLPAPEVTSASGTAATSPASGTTSAVGTSSASGAAGADGGAVADGAGPDGFGPGALPLTSRLEAAFHGRVGHLPPGTRTLLLIAAADHTGVPETLLAAATALGVGVEDLPPAQDAGIVLVDEEDRLRFRHPLMRAAIHQRAPLPERLAAHRALADAADPVHDPDHRAWHLAMAATGPDEEVAAALEATAVRARERSGHSAASVAYERAARLSPGSAARAGRLLLAAESASEAGELPRAREFAERAARAASDALPPGSAEQAVVRARALDVRALADFWQGAFPGAHRMLLEGAEAAAAADPERAGRMLVQAVHTGWYLGAVKVRATVGRLAALELPAGTAIRAVADFLAGALADALGPDPSGPAAAQRPDPVCPDPVPPDAGHPGAGHPEAGPPAPESVSSAASAARAGGADPRELAMLCAAGMLRGQDAESHALAVELAAECRDAGGLGRLATVLFFQAEVELFQSRLTDAHATAAEWLRIHPGTRQAQWVSQLNGVLAHVAALRGEDAECRARAAEALAAAPGAPTAPGASWAYWSQGLLDLGAGRARSALERLELLADPLLSHQISATRSVPDLVEAAVRVGEPGRAAEPFDRFERWARGTGQGWAAAMASRCRALLAPDEEAEEHFTAALAGHDPHRRPLEAARTGLLYGEWLRRARRRNEAAGRLRSALEVFERLGARPWADRSRRELDACGVPVTGRQESRSPADRAGLTPQESQIVRLAAQGLSNKDIAARLFLSPRTVGYHLYKAYPKLGVASRGELAALLG
ncbi:putative transcriptional regulator [Actinacidiphila reveromycinica]|uniref:Putative transcriptional regulator n=1 Tax=Actinacidiphila reveromycinica TaxID=659352 RepID=A0A7U3VLV6_9ACTN|nr:LuxR family transcriptional regulator [Streptomyces sp. SN-593]BBA95923.1 putative transcriptional regulator [Streptomyces sp. SN-593]